MIEEKEMADARTVEEDMKTSTNMTWLNNRVAELETEVKKLREVNEASITLLSHYVMKYRHLMEESE